MVQKQQKYDFLKSDMLVHDPDICSGCGICELMCSLYHEGEVSPVLARGTLKRDPFEAEYHFSSCRQCLAPSCYVSCPFPDKAIKIDQKTGVKYIVDDVCTGCKKCIRACPFNPPAIKFNKEKKLVYKCDLCRGRPKGPICVEYCPQGALSASQAKRRGNKNE